MQGLCRVKIVPKAFSAKDEVLEEGVMWEQIPGGLFSQSLIVFWKIIAPVLECSQLQYHVF